MLFPIITFITAITIAAIAAWFSVYGLMAIFTASAVAVAIMAVALEVGKLVSASWVYRNWTVAPFLLKSYLTIAVIILMLITSMGIFGFLSKAHLEQAADSEENTARIERIVQDMGRYETTSNRLEEKIVKLDNEDEVDTSKIQEQIDTEENRMDNVMVRIQPAIDEQNSIITNERAKDDDKVAPYLNQLDNLDNELVSLEEQAKKLENDILNVGKDTTNFDAAVKPFQDQIDKIKSDIATFKEMSKSGEQADIKKAQAVVGIPWGYWRNAEVLKEWNTEQAQNLVILGTKITEVRKDFERQYKMERTSLRRLATKLRGQDTQSVNERKMELLVKIEQARGIESSVISSAREEIKRLRAKADREVAGSLIILDRLRNELLNVSQIDNSVEIDALQVIINNNGDAIDGLIDQKFDLEREIRQIETEIGPIKYIAEMVYGNTERDTIDQAVRWLIIVFIFVFDPLAVLLLLAANYSFTHRNSGGKQEEIFDKVSFKKKK
jgi:peptidoglycan hydrolase CwlO-like protein